MKLMDAFVRLVLAFWSSAVLIGRDMVAIKANELTNIYIYIFLWKQTCSYKESERKKTLAFSVVQNCLWKEKSPQTESSDSASNWGNYHLPSSLLLLQSIKESDLK